ncbi:hypothetical protein EJ06DRAFT_527974 [Trichodelitschia bisporula]|uniref:Acetyltransferase n=1 Tax=Trichodelitschia bisporula TaxID=703511 RepID=A0A6G1I401_9PEZI|nr:hypothetical protein EJ06DRAFT_527974 [Trichodelitschia bisporula]
MVSSPSVGRVLLSLSALVSSAGAFLADWNETHIYNPRWPPHAKFHNGQTMSMGVALAVATLYYTWRTVPSSQRRESLFTAAVFGSIYFISALSAILYPDSKGMDPEFGEGFVQAGPFSACVLMNWVGYWMEIRRLRAEKIH